MKELRYVLSPSTPGVSKKNEALEGLGRFGDVNMCSGILTFPRVVCGNIDVVGLNT